MNPHCSLQTRYLCISFLILEYALVRELLCRICNTDLLMGCNPKQSYSLLILLTPVALEGCNFAVDFTVLMQKFFMLFLIIVHCEALYWKISIMKIGNNASEFLSKHRTLVPSKVHDDYCIKLMIVKDRRRLKTKIFSFC